MMGRGHALSGGAFWLGGCSLSAQWEQPQPVSTIVLGTMVCAGWALASDLDHPGSTVARSAGPVTRLLAVVLARTGALVHAHSRTHLDRPDLDGHRTVSHTVVWAMLCGFLVAAASAEGGPWVAAVLVFGATHVALTAVLHRPDRTVRVRTGFRMRVARRRWFRTLFGRAGQSAARSVRTVPVPVPPFAAAALGWVAYRMAPEDCWWLGLAVFCGIVVHCVGDMITNSGCPMLWPIPIGGRRWYPVGPPKEMRFNTGGAVETLIVHRILILATVGACLMLIWPAAGPVWRAFVAGLTAT